VIQLHHDILRFASAIVINNVDLGLHFIIPKVTQPKWLRNRKWLRNHPWIYLISKLIWPYHLTWRSL